MRLTRDRADQPPTAQNVTLARTAGALQTRAQAYMCGTGYAIVTTMPVDETKVISTSSVSARIIAAGIVIAFCYWASSVLVTLIVSVLLAYFLDPVVTWMEEWHIPRALGSLLVVLFSLSLMMIMVWTLVERVDQFGRDWPSYQKPLRAAASAVEKRMETFEAHVSEIEPMEHTGERVVQVAESHPVRTALFSRLGSLYAFILAATFVPFLVFFMLAAKRQVWHATMQLFPATERTDVKQTLQDISMVLRSYVIGTALVGLVLVGASWMFFLAMGLEFPFLMALLSGMFNLIPYLGVVLSWLPPLLIGLKQYHTATPFILIFAVLTILHLVAANLLVPALVGWRVRLNALALTLSLLFWGWLWGGMGLILAIPITAVIKVICDHVESMQPVGRWLSG
ncbi:MAG: AI-2E family transporter [Candidatus Acidiferrales bacterium]